MMTRAPLLCPSESLTCTQAQGSHLAQLLMNAQVVHHHDPIQDLQQGLLCDWLLRLFQRSPQQQPIVTMASLD